MERLVPCENGLRIGLIKRTQTLEEGKAFELGKWERCRACDEVHVANFLQLEIGGISTVSDAALAAPCSTPMRTFYCWEMAPSFVATAPTAAAPVTTRLKTWRS